MDKLKGKKKPRLTFTRISLGVTTIAVIIVIIYLSIPDKPGSPLPFEELYLYSKQLSRGIHLIDKSIADGFYKIGVPQENIIFLSVLPRQKDKYMWNFNRIEARVPNRYSVFEVGEEIRGRISNLPVPTEISIDKKSDNEIIYNVYYGGLYTHRLKNYARGWKGSSSFPLSQNRYYNR